MKKWLIIMLSVSLILNCFFIYSRIRQAIYEPVFTMEPFPTTDLYKLDITAEKRKFLKKLTSNHPTAIDKKYLFVNLWARNEQCMDQMLILDTLIPSLRNDMACVFANNGETTLARFSLKERNIVTKNFVYINECDSFIHALWKETNRKSIPFTGLLPMSIIMNKDGKVLYIDSLPPFTGFKMDTANDRKHSVILKNVLRSLE